MAFFILMPIALAAVLLGVLILLKMFKTGKLQQILKKMKKQLIWNGFLRSVIIGYLGYVTVCFTTLRNCQIYFFPSDSDLALKDDRTEVEMTILDVIRAILTLIFVIWFRRLCYNLIYLKFDDFSIERWNIRMSAITLGLDMNKKKTRSIYWYVHFLTRRILLGATLLFPFA